jgi:antitoxin YefM
MLIFVSEYESTQQTLDVLEDREALEDLRESREDFRPTTTFSAQQVRAELEQRIADGAR